MFNEIIDSKVRQDKLHVDSSPRPPKKLAYARRMKKQGIVVKLRNFLRVLTIE